MSVKAFLADPATDCPSSLLDEAKARPKMHVAVAAAAGPLPLQSIKDALTHDLVEATLFGDPDQISAHAKAAGLDLGDVTIEAAATDQDAANMAAKACAAGRADILMKGALHTDVFMKAAVSRDNGLRTGQRFIHLFALYPQHGGSPLLVSDAAVNVAPDMTALEATLSNMVQVWHKLGNQRPKIALLSATEHPIASVPSSEAMDILQNWAEQENLAADIRGPLALDLILSSEAARIKGLENDPVAGQAEGVIVPDLVSGNTLFKALVYLSGAVAAGVITGAKVPILLTSRADPPAARLASIALASLLRD